MNYCSWCRMSVAELGDTCDLLCYRLWINSYGRESTRSLILLGEEEPLAPKDLHLQPWYREELQRS